ncbi:MAG: hypothetical protein HY023_16025, partial [Chloroflexi bacterium]|nr:hypothetical protein [Chloroflexota bacterium]
IFELKRRLEQIHAAGGLVFDGLERGDPVKIVGGPFAGCEAVFDARLPGSERARVLLEPIRQSQSRHSFRSGARPSPRAIEEQARYVPLELNAGDIVKVKLSR